MPTEPQRGRRRRTGSTAPAPEAAHAPALGPRTERRRAVAAAETGTPRIAQATAAERAKHEAARRTNRPTLHRSDQGLLALAIGMFFATSSLRMSGATPATTFTCGAIALATTTLLMGRIVDVLRAQIGHAAFGVLNGFFGTIPFLLLLIALLRAGQFDVAKAAIAGSVLANVLLVFGFAVLLAGARHGRQNLGTGGRQLAMLLVLGSIALMIPTLAVLSRPESAAHEHTISTVISVLLLGLFIVSLPETARFGIDGSVLSGSSDAMEARAKLRPKTNWRASATITMLLVGTVASGFLSFWIARDLPAATQAMGLSGPFTGVVLLAIAGSAVENFAGVRLATRKQSSHAVEIILQSPVRITLTVAPAIVLLAPYIGAGTFTLVFSPYLAVAVVLTALIALAISLMGESTWFEGAALIVLFASLAAVLWWG